MAISIRKEPSNGVDQVLEHRGPPAPLAAPDAEHQQAGDQRRLPEQVEDHQVLGQEQAVEAGLHQPAAAPGSRRCARRPCEARRRRSVGNHGERRGQHQHAEPAPSGFESEKVGAEAGDPAPARPRDRRGAAAPATKVAMRRQQRQQPLGTDAGVEHKRRPGSTASRGTSSTARVMISTPTTSTTRSASTLTPTTIARA